MGKRVPPQSQKMGNRRKAAVKIQKKMQLRFLPMIKTPIKTTFISIEALTFKEKSEEVRTAKHLEEKISLPDKWTDIISCRGKLKEIRNCRKRKIEN